MSRNGHKTPRYAGTSRWLREGIEPPVPVARLNILARIVQTSPLNRTQTTRREVTMTSRRGAWLCVLQEADGTEEAELITDRAAW
jgi:hypothetical protein